MSNCQAPSEDQIQAAFKAFDRDGSGQINTTELQSVLNQCGVTVSPGQCAELIKMFDSNNSGQMEYNEFQKLIQEALKSSH